MDTNENRSKEVKSLSEAIRRARGFTLFELVVTLGVGAVLTAVAIPSFNGLVNSVRLSTTANDLFSGLMAARSEAIKRRSRVVLCKSADGAICAAAGGWEQGWMIFHDANNNGLREPSEVVLQVAAALPSDWRVKGNQTVNRYVSYDPTGGTKLVTGGFQAGTITICRAAAGGRVIEARQIIINATGRPRLQKATVDSCA
jgi:type IV fimbrial biogenesis protein FimT